MKKCLLMLFIFSLTVPALASVIITAEQEPLHNGGFDANKVTVRYNADSEANLPRAFALDIILTDAAGTNNAQILSVTAAHVGESNSASQGYGIFMGAIDLSDTDNPVWNTPVAPSGDPCVVGSIPGPNCTVELASLYSDPNYAPDSNGILFTFLVNSKVCTVTISENTRRGGVVMEDPDETVTVVSPGVGAEVVHVRCPGDICGIGFGPKDGKADIWDFQRISQNWNKVSPNVNDPNANISGVGFNAPDASGLVNIWDFQRLSQVWGRDWQ